MFIAQVVLFLLDALEHVSFGRAAACSVSNALVDGAGRLSTSSHDNRSNAVPVQMSALWPSRDVRKTRGTSEA